MKYMSADVTMWLACYRWLNRWSKTPAEFGVPLSRLDPRYFAVMDLIDEVKASLEKTN